MKTTGAVFFEPFDFAATLTLEGDASEVVPFKPRWVHVAYEGAWQGYKTGAFTFTPATLAQIVTNLRALERYKPNCQQATEAECAKHLWGIVMFDWRHLSEMDPRSVPIENQRAFGRVLDAEVRTPTTNGDISGLRSTSGKAELWAYSYFTDEAADRINKHEVKWLSITANPNGLNKRTGQSIGWVMTSIALTNQPFLEGLTALPFQMEDDGARGGAANGKGAMNLSKTSLGWLGLTKADDMSELGSAIHEKQMEFMALKKKCDEAEAECSSWKSKHMESEKLCKTMEAKCAEYERQFGHLKKVASDLPSDGFGLALAEQLATLKKVGGVQDNEGIAKLGIVMAEHAATATQFAKERPEYDKLLTTSVAGEKLDAKMDVDRVMAEHYPNKPEMRAVVEFYRIGAVPDSNLVSLEAYEARRAQRTTFLNQFPVTGTGNITQDFVGANGRTPFGTVAASGDGGLGIQGGERANFGQGHGRRGPIKLEAEGRGKVDIDLATYPGAPLQKAQTALRSAQPTRWKDCVDASHPHWVTFNREATRLLEAAVEAGQITIDRNLGFD